MAEAGELIGLYRESTLQSRRAVGVNYIRAVGIERSMTDSPGGDHWMEDEVNIPEEPGELVAWLARRRQIPKKASEAFAVEYVLTYPGRDIALDDEASQVILQRLSITSESDCKQIRDRIMNHPQWEENSSGR